MIKKLIKKLKSKAGESLIESMAAILVFTLASIALLSMLSSSADINRASKVADEQFQSQMLVAEEASGTGESGKVTFKLNTGTVGSGKVIADDNVTIYGSDEDDALYSYFRGGNG